MTRKCGTCSDGNGWVFTTDEGPGAVRPCPTCRPTTHALWLGGHLDPDHHCDDCAARRKEARR
ncbi:MAG: hypothetical protein LC798_19640 [Chloroflexi bacterium]|nr:hypothetical protein [Chloroflexota bacterium]